MQDYLSKEQINELNKRRSNYLNKKTINAVKKHKRFCLLDFPKVEQDKILNFFKSKERMVVEYVLKGINFPADWILVLRHENQIIFESKIVPIDDAIEHYSKGVVTISDSGVLYIGKITLQRKSGDPNKFDQNGRALGQQLQIKFRPSEVFKVKNNA